MKTQIEKISMWRWFRATVGGFLIGTFVVLATERYAQLLYLNLFEFSMIVLPTFIAYMQYRALSDVHNLSKRWIWAGVLSFPISSLILMGLDILLPHSPTRQGTFVILRVLIVSIIVGTYHASVLKKLNYKHTYIYAIGYVISFCLFQLLIIVLLFFDEYKPYDSSYLKMTEIYGTIAMACSYAVCTSLAFSYIQKQTFKDVVLPEDKWDKWRRDLSEKEDN